MPFAGCRRPQQKVKEVTHSMLARDRETLPPHYLITGGKPLRGEIEVSGAKNAVTKMVIASLLTTDL